MLKQEDLPNLKKQKAIAKGQLTRIEQFVIEKLSTCSSHDIESRLKFLNRYYESFDQSQSHIEMLEGSEGLEQERAEIEEKVMDLEAKLLQRKESLQGQQMQVNTTLDNSVLLPDLMNDVSGVKLPKFSGNYDQWPEFEDAVEVVLNNNRGLNDLKRFIMLKSALSGDALIAISNIKLTAANYQVAFQRLRERFFKKKLIFDSHIKRLFDMPTTKDTKTLRMLSDTACSILKQLEVLASSDEIVAGLVSYVIFSKCDSKIISDWEELWAEKSELPSWEKLISFLDTTCTRRECVELATTSTKINRSVKEIRRTFSAVASSGCTFCGQECGEIIKCPGFLALDPKDRYFAIKAKKMCTRCLNNAKGCKCTERCNICAKPHHELLHFQTNYSAVKPEEPVVRASSMMGVKNLPYIESPKRNYTLLGTAIVMVKNKWNHWMPMRCLLDSGSQINAITIKAVKRLAIPMQQLQTSVEGFGGQVTSYTKEVMLCFKSCVAEEKIFNANAVVINEFRYNQPSKLIDISEWQLPNYVTLADPNFNIPSSIDLILGAGIVVEASQGRKVKLAGDQPYLQDTVFGWTVSGDMVIAPEASPAVQSFSCFTKDDVREDLSFLSKFWEIEEVTTHDPKKPLRTQMEKFCEDHFLSNVERDRNGRVVVKLPFLKDPENLGSSFSAAYAMLNSIMPKIKSKPQLFEQYDQQLKDYLNLEHMQEVSKEEVRHFLPHFFVLKAESTSTPLRIVFHASCPTTSGVSLNDVLAVGPVIQPSLFEHLVSFRFPLVAVSVDVAKMYRQILVKPEDSVYQGILWSEEGKLKYYALKTLTFGTAPASFLACRSMVYLAEQTNDFPLGTEVIKDHFYVDNGLFGADSIDVAVKKLKQAKSIPMSGQMPLGKIMSNQMEVLKHFPESEWDATLKLGDDDVIKTLGLYWVPQSDAFRFSYDSGTKVLTKRQIISETARLFDPIGLAQPVVVIAKIMSQKVSRLKIGWDEPVPREIEATWQKFRDQLNYLKDFAVPRSVRESHADSLQYHGFCDASLEAYAAAIYVRTVTPSGASKVTLLVAKTKVAPLKTITLARLELCGALLLAKLFKLVLNCKIPKAQTFAWTDSKIALRWIAEEPARWVQFVANRVSEIQSLLPNVKWKHVPGKLNPADVASRGMWPQELLKYDPWINGPQFLYEPEQNWPNERCLLDNIPDERKIKYTFLAVRGLPDLVEQCSFSKLHSIIRVMSYIHRFIINAKTKKSAGTLHKNFDLNPQDLSNGIKTAIKSIQHVHFGKAMEEIRNRAVISDNRLQKLSPFIDEKGILRVGGRLGLCADLNYDTKFPAILPSKNKFTNLLFRDAHYKLFHAGPNAILAHVTQKYWIIRGKIVANRIVNNCIVCRKFAPKPFEQIMASLPSERVTRAERPFVTVGIDFAGPIDIKQAGRGSRRLKSYLAIFVCFATKAISIDVVEDLSSKAFINCFKRFCSIYGKPARVFTDNATNFKGVSNILTKINPEFDPKRFWGAVFDWCKQEVEAQIKWYFIPPRTPHQGGLWEAAVKAAKRHLEKVIMKALLTYDELRTIVTQIAAILNSRPYVPVSMNPKDDYPLTPAHFMIGQPFGSLVEPNLVSENVSTLKRWQYLISLKQAFWLKWSKEYLLHLQCRYKWNKIEMEPVVGALVLMVDRSIPSHTWSVGIIKSLCASSDGKVRAVIVSVNGKEFKRGITEICPLPMEGDETS